MFLSRFPVVWLLAVSMILFGATTVSAASLPPGSVGVFPTWTISGLPGAFSGTANFSASTAFPTTTITSNSTTARAPAGESAYLGASTGFGQNFGSSRSQPYLSFSQGAANTASITTITFDAAPPTGWGFALGDIDADWVEIVPIDAVGTVMSASVLGAQDTDNDPQLNFCNNVPKPSSCGAGPYTDVPAWLEAGGTYNGAVYPAGSVVGSGSDTSGSYDWFLPSSDVRQIQLTFTRIPSGFPIYQLWLAAAAPAATITGSLATAAGSPPPAGTNIALEQADGTPVLDIQEQPVLVPIAADGSFSAITEQGQYVLEITVPAGFATIPPIEVDATTPTMALAPIVVEVEPVVIPDEPEPIPPAAEPPPELAATGPGETTAALLWCALAAVVMGIAMTSRQRRSRATRRH